jgi:hypothetical protein
MKAMLDTLSETARGQSSLQDSLSCLSRTQDFVLD